MDTASRSRRTALVVVATLDLLVFSLGDGWRGLAGAVLAVAMVTLFFLGGRAPLSAASRTAPGMLFLLVSMGYVLRILLLAVALKAVGNAGWLDRDAVGVTIVVGALLWSAFLIHQQLTSKQPTLQIAGGSGLPPTVAG